MINIKRTIVKNSIQLILAGYLYNTRIGEEPDEHEKISDVPNILREMADEYEEEINKQNKDLEI